MSRPLSARIEQGPSNPSPARSGADDVLARITDYLGNGGLFNPEYMEHDKVRDLILACRETVAALTAEVERLKEELNQTEDVLVGEVQKRMAVERRHEASDHSLSWALDMVDRYDDEMIRRGDDPCIVLSRVHCETKRRARDILGNPPSDDRRDDYIGADPSQSPPARGRQDG